MSVPHLIVRRCEWINPPKGLPFPRRSFEGVYGTMEQLDGKDVHPTAYGCEDPLRTACEILDRAAEELSTGGCDGRQG